MDEAYRIRLLGALDPAVPRVRTHDGVQLLESRSELRSTWWPSVGLSVVTNLSGGPAEGPRHL
jgi:hypothetical protein